MLRLLLVLTFICLCSAAPLAAQELLNTKQGGAYITLRADHSDLYLQIEPSSKEAKRFESQIIETPSRIVVDLFGISVGKNYSLSPKQNIFLNKLRLGSHSDKLRIVLDLNLGQVEIIEQSLEKGVYILHFKMPSEANRLETESTPQASASHTAPPAQTATPLASYSATAKKAEISTPILLAVNTAKPSPLPTQAASFTPTLVPSATHTALALPSATKAKPSPKPTAAALNLTSSRLTLQNIDFEYLNIEKVPVLKLAFNAPIQFKLVKQDESTFELSIPDCVLANQQLSLPQFPPHDFIGFNLIQIRQDGSAVKIAIKVDKGQRIASVIRDNQILVRTLKR